MAIAFQAQAQAGAASVTMPAGITAGMYIVIYGYRNTTTAPGLPSGYTNVQNISANSNAARLAYKVADGTESGTTLTMTNANVVRVAVYSGVSRIGNNGSGTAAASTNPTMFGISTIVAASRGDSWVVGGFGSRQTTSTATPSSTTLRGTAQSGTTSQAIMFDSNGATVNSWPARNVAIGASATSAFVQLELLAAPTLPYNETFEGGSLPASFDTQTSNGGGTIVIDNTSKVDGTYSAKLSNSASGGALLTRNLGVEYSELYTQFKVFIPTAFSYGSSVIVVPLHYNDNSAGTVFEMKFEDYGTQEVILQGGTLGYTDTGLSISKGVVHTVEVYYKVSATVGAWKVWIDNGTFGSPNAQASSLNTGTATMRSVQLGNITSLAAFTDSYYVDSLTVSTSFVGLGPVVPSDVAAVLQRIPSTNMFFAYK